jgi:hypothetical protein
MSQDKIYIFGGEYATLDQFHHYRDMWALDLKTNIWEEVPASKVFIINNQHHTAVLRDISPSCNATSRHR